MRGRRSWAAVLSVLLGWLAGGCASSRGGRWEAELGLGAQAVPGRGGTNNHIAYRQFFGERWFADIQGRSGVSSGAWMPRGNDPLHMTFAAGGGLALAPWGAGIRPRIALRGRHVHHAPLSSWGDNPIRSVVGDSESEVRHRNGAELAFALAGDSRGSLGRYPTIWSVELRGGVLPSSSELGWNSGLVFSFGIASP